MAVPQAAMACLYGGILAFCHILLSAIYNLGSAAILPYSFLAL